MLADATLDPVSGLFVPRRLARPAGVSPLTHAARQLRGSLADQNGHSWPAYTPASGTPHPLFVQVDPTGHVLNSRPFYFYSIAPTVHVAAALTVMWDLFNNDASKIVRVRTIRQIPDVVTAVTGVATAWKLARTSAIGTTGTLQTPWEADPAGTDIDADVTLRLKPGGGATVDTILREYTIHSEETNAATIQIATQGGLELVPFQLGSGEGSFSEHGIVVRPGTGLRVTQETNSSAGNTGWLIGITVE